MAGPVSLPEGNKARWNELNEIVCDKHYHCNMAVEDKDGNPVTHDYVTYRVWLMRRNRLRTGKS